ncbi:MAG: hypothetical protein DSZ23_04065 [Thermodesulfatator sp.]|nr:MAG: hypothetical protein DSZ23_04065 [Thermodesulfatator sp.]
MHSYQDKNTGLSGSENSSRALPADIDRQLQLVSVEITEDMCLLASRLICGTAEPQGFSGKEEQEKVLRLTQELLFNCAGYFTRIAAIIGSTSRLDMVDRFLEFLADSFFQKFFASQDAPDAYEYFRMIFLSEYRTFLQDFEKADGSSSSPDQYGSRIIRELMESDTVSKGLHKLPRKQVKDLISQSLERKAFLKISRLLLAP